MNLGVQKEGQHIYLPTLIFTKLNMEPHTEGNLVYNKGLNIGINNQKYCK